MLPALFWALLWATAALLLAACGRKRAKSRRWVSQKTTFTKIKIPEASKNIVAASYPASMSSTANTGESLGARGNAGTLRALRTIKDGDSGEDQLSDYERRTYPAQNTAPPEIPDVSGRSLVQGTATPTTTARLPLTFASRGRVKIVPKDQKASWPVDKNRLVPRPERRLYPLRMIQEHGGWLIDRVGPTTGKRDPTTGELIPVYIWVPPSRPALARVPSADARTAASTPSRRLGRVASADTRTGAARLARIPSADTKTTTTTTTKSRTGSGESGNTWT